MAYKSIGVETVEQIIGLLGYNLEDVVEVNIQFGAVTVDHFLRDSDGHKVYYGSGKPVIETTGHVIAY